MKKVLICVLLVLCIVFQLLTLTACIDDPSAGVKTRDLIWAVGTPLPEAEDFVEDMPASYGARYAENYVFNATGAYQLSIILTDEKGRETTKTVGLRLIVDDQPPVITGVADISAYLGEGIAYRGGVTVGDNCFGAVSLQVDSSAVKTDQAGVYPVYYVAVDAAGNRTVEEISLYLYEKRVTLEELNQLLDPIIAQYIPTSGSREMQARAVYQYVYNHINYSATSDKSDWIRAAYEGLRRGDGDCFTYFALSKAFFRRLEIENMDITRTPGIVPERHYWNYVNIGTADEPRWYHFDACRLQGGTITPCLLTDSQVAAYTATRVYDNGVTGYFYAYDASAYPKSCETIITPTPALGLLRED